MKKFVLLFAAVSILPLAACVEQDQADAKMIKGCEAAIAAMLAPRTIKEVTASSGGSEDTMGSTYRRIKIGYIENDDFAETKREGTCLYSEQWGSFKSSHAALLEQVTWNGKLIGKKDGNIEGDMNDFLKLTEKVDAAMGQQ